MKNRKQIANPSHCIYIQAKDLASVIHGTNGPFHVPGNVLVRQAPIEEPGKELILFRPDSIMICLVFHVISITQKSPA